MIHELAPDLVNSLSAHVVVLDEEGTVIAVNAPWQRFARDHGGDAGGYLGASYLEECKRASLRGDNGCAMAVAGGISDLLAGRRTSFSVEYPCANPEGLRWFSAEGSAFERTGRRYVVLCHEDITARKATEAQLRQANAAVDAANRELQEVLGREQRMARTDELTGLHNRRDFFELARHLFSVAQRYGTPFSVVIFDLDHFKLVNDRHGHQAGDAVLRGVADRARDVVREADVLARYGGEEFIVALPNTDHHGALAVAEHLRKKIAAARYPFGRHQLAITISAGVAEMLPGNDSLDRLISRADEALYAAKAAGRDRCRTASALPSAPG